MEYKRCSRCVMDNASDHSISFDENGHCNYCNDVINRMPNEYFPNGKDKLEAMVKMIKEDGKGKEFDCIVGVSGGLDSSYIVYLGHKYGLRMLAVHIDDGLDTDISQQNVKNLCERAGCKLIYIRPDKEQYADLTLAFLKAAVPNLAIPQDNILLRELHEITKRYNIKYSLHGGNFAQECILERSTGINALDKTHIKAIHKRFGTKPINKLNIAGLMTYYIGYRYFSPVTTFRPLNYIDYNKKKALADLKEFCGYNYYGGKHYESILTRFMQCYYLPKKYGFDKRKSHFSSLIVSGQMTREEALEALEKPMYVSEELKEQDLNFLANYFGLSRSEFDRIVDLPAKQHSDYPKSWMEHLEPTARKFRRYVGQDSTIK